MKKYSALFKSYLLSELEDRGIFFVGVLIDLVSLLTVTLLWLAVFRTNADVNGYDFQKMITYYLMVPVISALTETIVIVHLPKRIKDGTISSDLMKPYNFSVGNLIHQAAKKASKLTLQIPIYLVVGLGFATFFNMRLTPFYFLLSLFVCFFSFLLHFLIDLAISYAAFWFDEVGALGSFKSAASVVFGGTLFPIDLAPDQLKPIFNILPFRLICYFPIKIAQGSVTPRDFCCNFIQLILWSIFFAIVCNFLWKSGVKKYGAYGN